MSTPRIDAAATVTAPKALSVADPTHQAGLIFRVANTTVSGQATAADVPPECRGRHWRLLTRGADVQWAWLVDADGIGGEDTVPTLVYDQNSATGTGHLAAAQTLLDSQPEHVYAPCNVRGVVFISSIASGKFEASISGDQTGKPK